MNGLKKFTQVLSKILEVCNWVAVGFMVVLFVLTLLPNDLWTTMIVQSDPTQLTLNAYGFELTVLDVNGALNPAAVSVFAIGAAFTFALMAMVFRNVALIIKVSRGEGKNSKGATPFQPDVTRMIREIGIFLLAIVAIEFIFSTVASVIIGADLVETSLNIETLVLGLLMLCLSTAFAEGESLQQDVEGLV